MEVIVFRVFFWNTWYLIKLAHQRVEQDFSESKVNNWVGIGRVREEGVSQVSVVSGFAVCCLPPTTKRGPADKANADSECELGLWT